MLTRYQTPQGAHDLAQGAIVRDNIEQSEKCHGSREKGAPKGEVTVELGFDVWIGVGWLIVPES